MGITWCPVMINLMVATLFCQSGTPPQQNMIRNGNFEQDSDNDGMADAWQFSGDSGVVATSDRDEGYQGTFSQRLNCTGFTHVSPASHAMLAQLDTVSLEKGAWYRFSFAAKQQGIRGQSVQVAISNTQEWSNCGLQTSFRASQEWRPFEFSFQATQTISDHVRLQFWYTSTGTLWLDDVRLEPTQPVVRRFTEVVPATDSLNLIPNSSFECGDSGWGSIADLPGWGGNLNQLVGTVDGSTRRYGTSSFRIDLTPETLPTYFFDYFPLYRTRVEAPLLANRGWISVEANTTYTLSAWMKADTDALVGVLAIHQAFHRTIQQTVPLTTDWELHTFTFQPQSSQVFIGLGADLGASQCASGSVWIDGVQLEQAVGASSYRPRTMVEVGLGSDQPGYLFPYGDEPEIAATLFNAGETLCHVQLHTRTTNFDDAVVHQTTLDVEVPAYQSVRVPIHVGVRDKGFYRLHLEADGAEVALTRSQRFAIIEPYTDHDSFFGMNHAYPWPQLLDLSKQIGLCWFRDWSLKWHDVEPEQGQFDFGEADHQINRVLEHGLHVLPLLPFPSSNWCSSAEAEVGQIRSYPENRKRAAYMPHDLEAFAAYVRTTVQRYRDRLHVWEILNEPIYTDYALPARYGYQVEDYVRLLEVAYRAVKQADPNAFVIGGIAGGPTTYTREFIDAGGLIWVDTLNLHMYPGLTAPDAYEEPLRQLREVMRQAGADKPIWFTEGAYYADDDTPVAPFDAWLKPLESESLAAEWLVKFNTILLAYGVEKIIYHSGTPGTLNNESLSGIFFEWAGAPRKMLVTQTAMAHLLPATVHTLGPLDTPQNVKAYGFSDGKRTVVVAWLEGGIDPMQLSLATKGWHAVDIQGNTLASDEIQLSERPVYLIGEGDTELPW